MTQRSQKGTDFATPSPGPQEEHEVCKDRIASSAQVANHLSAAQDPGLTDEAPQKNKRNSNMSGHRVLSLTCYTASIRDLTEVGPRISPSAGRDAVNAAKPTMVRRPR